MRRTRIFFPLVYKIENASFISEPIAIPRTRSILDHVEEGVWTLSTSEEESDKVKLC